MTLLATKNSPASIDKGNLAMFRWDATGALARTALPVLLIAGEIDIVTKPRASREIAQTMPSAAVRVIEGVNHMGMLERAEDYNSAIAAFAGRVIFTRPS